MKRNKLEKHETIYIKKKLIEKGILSCDLAKELGVSSAFFSMVINGKKNFTKKIESKLKEIGIDLADLKCGGCVDFTEEITCKNFGIEFIQLYLKAISLDEKHFETVKERIEKAQKENKKE